MGASNSRQEEDISLKLCYDRKKFVEEAIGCRCVLADAHLAYIQSLTDTGRVLLHLFDPQAPIEPDLHDSTDTNKKPPMPKERHSNEGRMRKTEEMLVSPVNESVTVPNEKLQDSVSAPLPWDYFNLSQPVDDQQSSRKINGCHEGLDGVGECRTTMNTKDERNANEPKLKVQERNVSNKFDKDCDKLMSEGIVGSFENTNLASHIFDAISSPSIDSVSSELSEIFPIGRNQSPDLSPLREIAPSVSEVVHLAKLVDLGAIDIQENTVTNKANPDDLYLRLKDINQLFIEASECRQEVLRMLEANSLHFHRPDPKQKGEWEMSWFLSTFFCHQEETSKTSRELGESSKRHLTSQRNMSARSFLSIAGQNPSDESLSNLSNDIYCMRSGSHVSTLERLYAWEKKLYDEVKASQIIRRLYDRKCELLRHQESKAEPAKRVDKTRTVIKDLHYRIKVSIKRMETISGRIIQIRDSELQPHFEELIKGLGNMWRKMHEFHKRQFDIISTAFSNPTEIAINSDDLQQLKYHLQQQLSLNSSNYTRLIYSFQSYLKEIEGWLLRCFTLPEKSLKKTSKHQQHIPISKYSPPFFITCRSWLEGFEKLAAVTTNSSVDVSNNFCTSLVQIFSQLMTLSESSAQMYNELDKITQDASSKYEQLRKLKRS